MHATMRPRFPGMPAWDTSDVTCRIDLDILRASTSAPPAGTARPPAWQPPHAPIPASMPSLREHVVAATTSPASGMAAPLPETSRRVLVPPTRAADPARRKAATLVIGTTCAVLAVLVGLLLLPPRRGDLRVDVRGADSARAEVYIDGVKHCDVAPCVARDLRPGPHTIQVFSAGRVAEPVVEHVEAGTQRGVLVPMTPAPVSGPCPAVTAARSPVPEPVVVLSPPPGHAASLGAPRN